MIQGMASASVPTIACGLRATMSQVSAPTRNGYRRPPIGDCPAVAITSVAGLGRAAA